MLFWVIIDHIYNLTIFFRKRKTARSNFQESSPVLKQESYFVLRHHWRLKWLSRIAVICFQLIGNVNQNSHAKFQVDTTKIYRDIGEQIFVSRADLAGKVRHHRASKTLSFWFGTPQGWSRWRIDDTNPCNPIQMTLFDHGGGSSNTYVGDSFQGDFIDTVKYIFLWNS